MRAIGVLRFALSLLLLPQISSFSLKKGVIRLLDLERSESSLPLHDNFPEQQEHQRSDIHTNVMTTILPGTVSFDADAWLKWTQKVVPVVMCIGLIGHVMGGSADVLLMMSTIIVFGLMFMEIMEGGKIPFDAVGREGLNNAANKINKLGRESVLIITGGIVISMMVVVAVVVVNLMKLPQSINKLLTSYHTIYQRYL